MKLTFISRFEGSLPLPDILSQNVFSSEDLRHKENIAPGFDYATSNGFYGITTSAPKIDNLVLEEIQRLRKENAYLSSLIKSLIPNVNGQYGPITTTTTQTPTTVQTGYQDPVVLKLKVWVNIWCSYLCHTFTLFTPRGQQKK